MLGEAPRSQGCCQPLLSYVTTKAVSPNFHSMQSSRSHPCRASPNMTTQAVLLRALARRPPCIHTSSTPAASMREERYLRNCRHAQMHQGGLVGFLG